MAAVRTSTSHLTPSERKRAYCNCSVDGSDEDRTRQKTRDEIAGNEQQDGAHDTGKVGQERAREHCGRCIGGVEGRNADDEPEQNTDPETGPGDEHGRGGRRHPVNIATPAGEVFIKLGHGQYTPQQHGEESGRSG